MAYIVNDDVGNYLNITLDSNGQAMVDTLITNLQKTVDNYCNRTWSNTGPITEYFDAIGENGATRDTFFVSQPQVDSVVSITIAGQTVDAQYINNYGSYIKIWVFPGLTYLFPLYNPRQAIEVVYNTKSTTVPDDVKQALIQWVAQEFLKSPDAGRSTYLVQTGQVKVQYEASRVSNQDNAMPDFVKMVLDNYRLQPIDHF